MSMSEGSLDLTDSSINGIHGVDSSETRNGAALGRIFPISEKSPHPIRVRGPDLWYQMALVDTTVEQSLVSSAGGTRGRECVRGEEGSPRRGKGWVEGWVGGEKRVGLGEIGEGRKDSRR